MKTSFLGRTASAILTALGAGGVLWCAQAFPPLPHHTIHGMVRDEIGEPVALASAEVFLETTNGISIATRVLPGVRPGENYQLGAPMDAFLAPDPYKSTALRSEAPFRLKVKIAQTAYLPLEMAGNLANLGKPAQSTRIDLTLGVDANGDGIPDAWQQLLIDMLGPTARIGPYDDADGDGISNLNEYLAGTFAFDPADGFRLDLVRGPQGTPLLEFLAIKGRTYTVYASTNLQAWTPVEFKIPADGPAAASRPNYYSSDIRILQIEPIVPPSVPTSRIRYFFKAQVQ